MFKPQKGAGRMKRTCRQRSAKASCGNSQNVNRAWPRSNAAWTILKIESTTHGETAMTEQQRLPPAIMEKRMKKEKMAFPTERVDLSKVAISGLRHEARNFHHFQSRVIQRLADCLGRQPLGMQWHAADKKIKKEPDLEALKINEDQSVGNGREWAFLDILDIS
jgi:hypothetical protein